MAHLRRALAPLTAIWLFCQVGTVALAPAALWITAADPHAAQCTCGHGADAMCPMHHKQSSESNHCAMRAANGNGTAVVTTLIGIAGLIPGTTRSIGPAVPSIAFRSADVHVAGERPVPPDPPPPRA